MPSADAVDLGMPHDDRGVISDESSTDIKPSRITLNKTTNASPKSILCQKVVDLNVFESRSTDAIKLFCDVPSFKSDHDNITSENNVHSLPFTAAAKNMMTGLTNGNYSNKNTPDNTQQQTRSHSDDNGQNEENSSRNTDFSRGNGGDGNGKENKRDDEKKTGTDTTEEEDDEDETENDEDEKKSECEHKLNANAPQFVKPLESIDETKPLPPDSSANVISEAATDETPQQMTPAPGHIAISKNMTNEIVPSRITQRYHHLYQFMNKSLIFKNNQSICNTQFGSICVINYGFYDKETNEILYCIANEVHRTKRKHKWHMMDRLFTENEIKTEFNIASDTLPPTILDDEYFSAQLTHINIDDVCSKSSDLISKTKWHNIPIYTKRNNMERKTLSLTLGRFRHKIQQFYDHNMKNIDLVPIVNINNKETYCIEHVWVVHIENNITIGIALQYDTKYNKIRVVGIHLDKEYLCKSHQLIPTPHDCHCLDSFHSFYDNIVIGSNMNLEKENLRLRQEITELQEQQSHTTDLELFIHKSWKSLPDISHRREAADLLQASTSLVGSLAAARDEGDEKHHVSETNAHIQPTNPIHNSITNAMNIYTTPLCHTVSSPSALTPTNTATIPICGGFPMISPVTSQLSAMHMNTFRTLSLPQSCTFTPSLSYIPSVSNLPTPQSSAAVIGAPLLPQISTIRSNVYTVRRQAFVANVRKDILIEQHMTKYYLSRTKFEDTQRMYYYLMQSITMQIIDQYATVYNDTIAIVCCDLRDRVSYDALYAVIIREQNQQKYKWKVVSLSTFNEIATNYPYIRYSELPPSSRSAPAFKSQLNQREKIMNAINKNMERIQLRRKIQVKSKKRNRYKYNVVKQEIKMSEKEMRQYIKRSVHHKNPIPIIRIKGNKYWIEWIIICEIKKKGLHFGVLFGYNVASELVEATNIFLDGVEIEKQNQLVNVDGFCDFNLNMFMSGISKIHFA